MTTHTKGKYSYYPMTADLYAIAAYAPHSCGDPLCPGEVNRRKLEAFDGLLEAAKHTHDRLSAWRDSLIAMKQSMTDELGRRNAVANYSALCDALHVAIAKSDPATADLNKWGNDDLQ